MFQDEATETRQILRKTRLLLHGSYKCHLAPPEIPTEYQLAVIIPVCASPVVRVSSRDVGQFQVLPVQGLTMYAPEIRALSAERRLEIREDR